VLAYVADLPPNERARFAPPEMPEPARAAALRTPLTKPPLLAWTVFQIDAAAPDDDFLAETYPALVRAHDWWRRETDRAGDGLCAYDHPYSSGLDDSPLWDGGPPVTAPELNAYLALGCDALADIAARIGRAGDAPRWREEARRLTERLLALQWDPAAGLFWATRRSERISVRTPFNLMPLLTGRLPQPVAARLVATLTDPAAFWPRFPVPTVARDDPAYDPQTMWRGPVWMNVNLLLAEGLRRSGFADEAARLGERTLAMAMTQADFSEYYHPDTGGRPPRAAPMFSWSAAAFIEFALAATAAGGA
jgi:glycogen debranching enzyme